MKGKSIHLHSRFTDKGPPIAEKVFRTIRKLIKKPRFEKGNANWLSELSSITTKNYNTNHSSTKMTPIQASKKSDVKEVYSNLQDRRNKQQPKYKLRQLVRTADIKKVFSKGDSTNYNYNFYTITEVIHDTIPSYRIVYLPERYNENLLVPTKLALEEHNKVMKRLNLTE